MKAELITIGDEILIGQIVDTNSAWMGRELNAIGLEVFQISSVSDSEEHILDALDQALSRAQVVILTGGLGPTRDDKTKEALCRFFKCGLRFDTRAYEDVDRLFRMRGREVTEVNRRQAEVVELCRTLYNAIGTAPGMWFDYKGKVVVSLPGVPREMKSLMTGHVLPLLRERFELPFILHKTLLTQGIGESFLASRLVEFEDEMPAGFSLAYLPSEGMVRLRLSGRGQPDEVRRIMQERWTKLSALASEWVFGEEGDQLQEIIGRLLREKGWTLATAESCTGGYMGHLITSVPGSSEYYLGSTVTYSYPSKTQVLGVSADDLVKQGAVSETIVLQMAQNVAKLFGSDCALSSSGVAGPGGGTAEKPVGTVWIGLHTPNESRAIKLLLGDNRLNTIKVASESALNLLRKSLID